jgi:hypothetical protein
MSSPKSTDHYLFVAAAIRFVGFVVMAAFGKERPLILKAERGSNALA